ncbi:O-antigen ligase family protein [Microbulbifer sp. 2304DJ12-6]|uniref:O-antigen ligase family protein n=1 Tax=Microbulbifer sp. 2304DJ12-6 TaxID=3233340 RepID=UPI0039B05CAE
MAWFYKALPTHYFTSYSAQGSIGARQGSGYGWLCVAVCSLWFFLTLNPFHILVLELGFGYYDYKRVLQVGLICSAALLVFFKVYRAGIADVIHQRGMVLPWLVSCLFIFISAALSDHPCQSALESIHWLLLLSVFTVGVYIARVGLSQWLLGVFLFCHGLVVIKSLLFFGFEVFVSGALRAEMIFPFVDNFRFFNQIQVFIIPLLMLFSAKAKFYRLAYLFLFFNFLLAFASGARGLLLSTVVAGLLSFIFLKPWRREILIGLVVCVAAFLVYFLIVNYLGDGAYLLRSGTSRRIDIWKELLGQLSAWNVFIGNGMGSYTFHNFTDFVGHPHNSILQFLYEWGGIATASAIAAILCLNWASYQQIKSNCIGKNKDIQVALLVALCAASVYSLFGGILVMPAPQVLFFLFVGLLVGGGNRKKNTVLWVSPSGSVALRFICAVFLVVFVELAGKYLIQQAGQQEGHRGPRFWANGAPLVLSGY